MSLSVWRAQKSGASLLLCVCVCQSTSNYEKTAIYLKGHDTTSSKRGMMKQLFSSTHTHTHKQINKHAQPNPNSQPLGYLSGTDARVRMLTRIRARALFHFSTFMAPSCRFRSTWMSISSRNRCSRLSASVMRWSNSHRKGCGGLSTT